MIIISPIRVGKCNFRIMTDQQTNQPTNRLDWHKGKKIKHEDFFICNVQKFLSIYIYLPIYLSLVNRNIYFVIVWKAKNMLSSTDMIMIIM